MAEDGAKATQDFCGSGQIRSMLAISFMQRARYLG
jgi:hypothetical protein